MTPEPENFNKKAAQALKDPNLINALKANREFAANARASILSDPLLESMKAHALTVKNHTLDHLAAYLCQYEQKAKENGIKVYWAPEAKDARAVIRQICLKTNARTAVCGKSMIAAETEAPRALEECGVTRFETDLGEYILQLAGDEPPSHVNGPAAHKTLDQIRALFNEHMGPASPEDGSGMAGPEALLTQVRRVLRDKFLTADIGIIGANFLIAETGANVLVSNEGNADLSALLPRTRIILASIEKVLPRMADAEVFLRLLCLSATGQKATAYQSFYHGPGKTKGHEGPENVHLILLDNGRSSILHSKYRPILRCIRCGACMDNCPVYNIVGGHAYGWIYPGPMGVIWTSQLNGLKGTKDLAHACSLNGHCSEVCPMGIPLKEMIRLLREDQWEEKMAGTGERIALEAWGKTTLSPNLYHRLLPLAGHLARFCGAGRGHIRRLPGGGGWTTARDMPAFRKKTFHQLWKESREK